MIALTYDTLGAACSPGGGSVLVSRTELGPAAGDLAGVAPARFVDGQNAVYAYETRFDGEEAVTAVVLLSKGAALNKIETQLAAAIRDGDPLLSRTPHLVLRYDGMEPLFDLDLPHRAFDGHVRAGTIDGRPATEDPRYRAVRDASPANARALLETSPITLVLGGWDSTRRSNQGRYRSALVGEVVGVLADQKADPVAPRRGAARTDTVAPSVRLTGAELEEIVAAQEGELSPKNVEKIRGEITKSKAKPVSAAGLGLGSIPPSMDGLGLVSCRRIVRHHVLSFAALRQLRFGLGVDGDVAGRALLAALALSGLARSDAELELRANCDLKELAPSVVELDARYGVTTALEPLTISTTDALLEQAITRAVEAGVRWEGQILEVVGDPRIAGGILETED